MAETQPAALLQQRRRPSEVGGRGQPEQDGMSLRSASPQPHSAMVFRPKDYEAQFDARAYLDHFYSKDAMEDGTRLSLFALPSFAALLETMVPPPERRRMVDIGAGPTVYSAVCFRNTVEQIYLTDFLQQNIDHLDAWLTRKRSFDWSPVIKVIARTEGLAVYPDPIDIMESEARNAVERGGLFRSNVHESDVIIDANGLHRDFDVMVSVFCLESACTKISEYQRAMNNMVKQIRPGGFLILGSVIEDDCYTAGISKDGQVTFFTLLSLTEQNVTDTLRACGCEVVQMLSLHADGVCFLMARKRSRDDC